MTTVIDPVCGMELEEADVVATLELAGRTYSFCSEGCREQLLDEPEDFVDEALDVGDEPH